MAVFFFSGGLKEAKVAKTREVVDSLDSIIGVA